MELALEREASQRAAFLLGACGDDESLRREVEELVQAHEQAGSFIESPALGAAPQVASKRRDYGPQLGNPASRH